jgi:guanylate kinase
VRLCRVERKFSALNSGKIIIFTAPSGAGKTTLARFVMESEKKLEFSISATTRPMRKGEVEGKDYFFITREEFQKKIEADAFIEFEEVYPGTFYGTLKSELEKIWSRKSVAVFDVDVQGALNLKKRFQADALSIFVMPPSLDILEKRLRARGTETDSSIHTRLAKAFDETDSYRFFDFLLINENLSVARESVLREVQRFLLSP